MGIKNQGEIMLAEVHEIHSGRTDLPVTVEIADVIREGPNTKTLLLGTATNAKPGQFFMLWIPDIDEKPFTASFVGKRLGITFQRRGEFTHALFEMRKGMLVGIRGPYGNGFSFSGKEKACVVGGGTGIAGIATLAEALEKPDIILGVRTKEDLFFHERLKKAGNLYITTQEGGAGEKGLATDVLERLLKENEYEKVFACGPEMMEVKVAELCQKYGVEVQASLERFMVCGFGICGQCVCGSMLVCKDGPVFTGEQLEKMKEFGKSARTQSGRLVSLKEYAARRTMQESNGRADEK